MRRALTALVCAAVLAACASVQPQRAEKLNLYLLEAGLVNDAPRPGGDLVIEIGAPSARAGFDTDQMAFTRKPGEIEYFTRSRWVDTPARMLAPAVAQAIEQSHRFRAVLRAPNALPADLRLDIELVRLQQNFSGHPSRIEMSVRAQLAGTDPARVLASAQFDEVENASTDDPYGGVAAANRALTRLVARVADFCAHQAPRP